MGPDDITALLVRRFPAENAEDRIPQARAALAAAGGDRAKRTAALTMLATCVLNAYRANLRRPEVDEGIDALREAIALTPRGRPARNRAEQMLVMLLSARRSPGDTAAAIELAESMLARVRTFTLEHAIVALCLGNALFARHMDEGGQDDVDRAIAIIEQAYHRVAVPRRRVAGAIAGMVGLGLAIGLAGRFQHSSAADSADFERIQDLLADIDVDVLSEFVPDARSLIEIVRLGAPGALAMVGNLNNPRQILASGALALPQAEAGGSLTGPMAELVATIRGISDSMSFGFEGNLHVLDNEIAQQRVALRDIPDAGHLRVTMLVGLATVLHTRFRTRRLAELPEARQDLDEAVRLGTEAMADPLTPASGEAQALMGRCLLDRYQEGLGSAADVDEAVRLLERAVYRERADSRAALATRIGHSEALMLRAHRDGAIEDLDAAIETLTVFQRRLPSGSPFGAVVDARIAVVYQHRAAALQETEDLLQASLRSRIATEAVAEVSLTWAYDSAWHWANWAWHHAPAAEKADAHQQAMASLYRLTRAQVTRESAEIILRRQTRSLTARAIRAAVAAQRPGDAVVAAETGRAVLLSLALQQQETELSTVDPVLRERFRLARERLAAAEAMVA